MCISDFPFPIISHAQMLRHPKHVEVSSNLLSVTSKINTIPDTEAIIHTGKKLKTVWHFLLNTFQKHTRKETEKGTKLQKSRIHPEKLGDPNSHTECTLKLGNFLRSSFKVVPYYVFFWDNSWTCQKTLNAFLNCWMSRKPVWISFIVVFYMFCISNLHRVRYF